jgi:hypothetical protein
MELGRRRVAGKRITQHVGPSALLGLVARKPIT